jgi:hypothetical protein
MKRGGVPPKVRDMSGDSRLGSGLLGALEVLVLGLVAALLVLWVFPSTFAIEADCLGPGGVQRTIGDSYFAAAAVVGTLGWLVVGVGVVHARIAEAARMSVLLPLTWFVVFVGVFLVFAAAVGPELCPS